jgi:predicted nucleic acid-binding protein
MRGILLDTDIWVDYLRGIPKAVDYVKAHAEHLVLSVIIIAELYAGVKDNDERDHLDELISLFPVLPITAEIAKMGGLYKRDYFRSHGVGLADGLLAATAQIHQMELKTLDIKHYPMFRELKPLYRKMR